MVYLDCPEVSQKVELGIFKLAYKLDHKVRQLVVDHIFVIDTQPLLRGVVDPKLVRLEVNTSEQSSSDHHSVRTQFIKLFLKPLGSDICNQNGGPVDGADEDLPQG